MAITTTNTFEDEIDLDNYYYDNNPEEMIELFDIPNKVEIDEDEEIEIEDTAIDEIEKDEKVIAVIKKKTISTYKITHIASQHNWDCITNLTDWAKAHFKEFDYKSPQSLRGALAESSKRHERNKSNRKWVVERIN